MRRGDEVRKNKGQRPANPSALWGRSRSDAFALCRWPLPNCFFVGVPLFDLSFQGFTASLTVEKGTPTAQRLDNRSIAKLLSDRGRCSSSSFPAGAKEHFKWLPCKALQDRLCSTRGLNGIGLRVFTLRRRDLTHPSLLKPPVCGGWTLTENWREPPALPPRSVTARTSSSCSATRLG